VLQFTVSVDPVAGTGGIVDGKRRHTVFLKADIDVSGQGSRERDLLN